MNRGRYFWLLVASLMVGPSQAWQDDIDLNLRHPFVQRAQKDGVSLFSKPIAEVRLGRYLLASNHHAWRGGVIKAPHVGTISIAHGARKPEL